jgi:hypothetical protein
LVPAASKVPALRRVTRAASRPGHEVILLPQDDGGIDRRAGRAAQGRR